MSPVIRTRPLPSRRARKRCGGFFSGNRLWNGGLARSTSGDLLAQVYLETRQALEVRNQGGVWVKVNRLQMLSAEPENLPDDVGFVSRCRWTVQGSVGHWGHVHRRKNRYDARLRVQAVDGTWRVTQLELLDEQRLEAF